MQVFNALNNEMSINATRDTLVLQKKVLRGYAHCPQTGNTWALAATATPFCRSGSLRGLERHTGLVPSGATRAKTVYGVSSLTAARANATPHLDLVRAHWGIENRSH